MKNPLVIKTIDPLDVAEKLDAVRNFLLPTIALEIEAEPRLVEALHFLQWISIPENYPGGLSRFAEELIKRFSDEIGVDALIEKRGKKLSSEDVDLILSQLPYEFRSTLEAEYFGTYLSEMLDGVGPEEDSPEKQKRSVLRKKFTFELLHQKCLDHARSDLANFLHKVCSIPDFSFTSQPLDQVWSEEKQMWYFPRLWKCLFAWMDEHASNVLEKFAETTITKDIFRWLELASESGKGVMFIGHSRFGKSIAVRSFAQMYPGRARIVECPSSASESDLLREVSRCLGIRFSNATTPLHEQRAAIDHVLRQAKFLLIFDEAQFLFPQAGNRRAVPPRLNYVRRAIMDIGVPTAFICTHQNWKHVQKNFLKVSAYSTEQFEGRLLRSPLHLAAELSEAEMIEVARIHLPELDDDYLTVIVRPIRSFNGGDHLSSIANIAVIARSYAKSDGRSVPTLRDVERATDDVLGCADTPPPTTPDLQATPAPTRKKASEPITPIRGTRPTGFETNRDRGQGVLTAAQ